MTDDTHIVLPIAQTQLSDFFFGENRVNPSSFHRVLALAVPSLLLIQVGVNRLF